MGVYSVTFRRDRGALVVHLYVRPHSRRSRFCRMDGTVDSRPGISCARLNHACISPANAFLVGGGVFRPTPHHRTKPATPFFTNRLGLERGLRLGPGARQTQSRRKSSALINKTKTQLFVTGGFMMAKVQPSAGHASKKSQRSELCPLRVAARTVHPEVPSAG